MKTVSKLILLCSLLAAPLALMAKTSAEAYVESYRNRTDMPVPVKVVTPRVASDYAGTVVKLEFTIDGAGLPRGIIVLGKVPSDLADSLTTAVADWKFQPLLRDGKAIPTRVVLPVRIVDEFGDANRVAVN